MSDSESTSVAAARYIGSSNFMFAAECHCPRMGNCEGSRLQRQWADGSTPSEERKVALNAAAVWPLLHEAHIGLPGEKLDYSSKTS